MVSTARVGEFVRKHPWETAALIGGVLAINVVFVAGGFRGSTLEPGLAGQLGDFVGGYIGTYLLLFSVVGLLTTIRAQNRATFVQHFESRYLELIRLHRDNVEEFRLGDATGRKVFVLLLREWREICKHVKSIAAELEIGLDQRGVLHVAYYVLFYGVGPNSSRMLRASLATFPQQLVTSVEQRLNDSQIKKTFDQDRRLGYTPFEGHQSRLGHYYRHLYQAFRYIASKHAVVNSYEYAKTLRAQLSTHEQALLLINSLTPVGADWWERRLLVEYRIVQKHSGAVFRSIRTRRLRTVRTRLL